MIGGGTAWFRGLIIARCIGTAFEVVASTSRFERLSISSTTREKMIVTSAICSTKPSMAPLLISQSGGQFCLRMLGSVIVNLEYLHNRHDAATRCRTTPTRSGKDSTELVHFAWRRLDSMATHCGIAESLVDV